MLGGQNSLRYNKMFADHIFVRERNLNIFMSAKILDFYLIQVTQRLLTGKQHWRLKLKWLLLALLGVSRISVLQLDIQRLYVPSVKCINIQSRFALVYFRHYIAATFNNLSEEESKLFKRFS